MTLISRCVFDHKISSHNLVTLLVMLDGGPGTRVHSFSAHAPKSPNQTSWCCLNVRSIRGIIDTIRGCEPSILFRRRHREMAGLGEADFTPSGLGEDIIMIKTFRMTERALKITLI